ncbi:MAG: OmpA family protein [Betaproteobacteria bacterium]
MKSKLLKLVAAPRRAKPTNQGPRRPPRKRIFFAAADWRVDERYHGALQMHAAYLRWNPAAVLLLTGHTAGRGNTGYNRAMGLRRAKAVRAALVSLGAPRHRISVETLGRVRDAKGVAALAIARRRRAEFHYLDLALQSAAAIRPKIQPPESRPQRASLRLQRIAA